jgi:hypothetical protein
VRFEWTLHGHGGHVPPLLEQGFLIVAKKRKSD